jgi:hypothetical protein
LVEFVERHRDISPEDLVFELDQRSMKSLVLYVEAMVPAMLGQTTVSQQGPNENCFLSGREFDKRFRTSLGVIPK